MALSYKEQEYLQGVCLKCRKQLIDILYHVQTGHPGGSLSCTEILVLLYFKILKVDPEKPQWEARDRFILSKGHAAPMLYIVLANRGYFPEQELFSLRQLGSRLQGHPCAHKLPGIDLSTGPLGLGLSAANGMAMVSEMGKNPFWTYVLLGDGELQEGVIWEAVMTAGKYQTNRLIAVVDRNRVQLDGTVDTIKPLGNLKLKFESSGWNVIETDGHNLQKLESAFKEAKAKQGPVVILADTVKGKGIPFMEGKNIWHGKAIDEESYYAAQKFLRG